MNISTDVETYIETYKDDMEKELRYVTKKDWSIIENISERSKEEKRQRLITDRNVDKLKHFAGISNEDRRYKKVKSFIELLKKFPDIYIRRYQKCSELFDWTEYEDSIERLVQDGLLEGLKEKDEMQADLESLIENEIDFQSKALEVVSRIRLTVNKLNLDEENKSIDVPIHSDIPAPFLLRKKLEKEFPKLKEFLNAKKEK